MVQNLSLTLLIGVFLLILIVWSVTMQRQGLAKQRHAIAFVDVSLELQRQGLEVAELAVRLTKQSLELQEEAVRLLRQIAANQQPSTQSGAEPSAIARAPNTAIREA
jgi:hypothetical protein